MPRKNPTAVTAGDVVVVGLQSWAGLTWHRATVLRVCHVRIKVRWDDASTLRHVQGRTYYVPPSAIREAE